MVTEYIIFNHHGNSYSRKNVHLHFGSIEFCLNEIKIKGKSLSGSRLGYFLLFTVHFFQFLVQYKKWTLNEQWHSPFPKMTIQLILQTETKYLCIFSSSLFPIPLLSTFDSRLCLYFKCCHYYYFFHSSIAVSHFRARLVHTAPNAYTWNREMLFRLYAKR